MAKQLHDSFFDEPAKPKKASRKPAARPSPAVAPEPEKVQFAVRGHVVDWDFQVAIRALDDAGMLHEDTREEFAYALDPYYGKPELKTRVNDWRQQHGILG